LGGPRRSARPIDRLKSRMMPIEQVESLLAKAFPGETVQVENPQGDGEHYQVLIVSAQFQDKSMVEQHQMVYAALGGAMRSAIHAMALRTFTPEQWSKRGGRA
jgi:acid stress-induced BolA-like protein IbaG/YrbA